jgi:putative ABC transport system permease protein
MGGSIISITKLLSWTTLKPILIAIVLFSPLAWIAMNRWLSTYAYRISMNVWILIAAGLSIILVALAIVSIQTVQAARANPVDSLRDE